MLLSRVEPPDGCNKKLSAARQNDGFRTMTETVKHFDVASDGKPFKLPFRVIQNKISIATQEKSH